jgi:hypothetical protein
VFVGGTAVFDAAQRRDRESCPPRRQTLVESLVFVR